MFFPHAIHFATPRLFTFASTSKLPNDNFSLVGDAHISSSRGNWSNIKRKKERMYYTLSKSFFFSYSCRRVNFCSKL